LNNQKFAFIICSNNKLLLNECLQYINLLYIPSGYTIETIIIERASSITSGYNNGMNSSDAKYKIYMHQDVFIINRRLLYDILDIFAIDNKIGMIGLAGSSHVSPDGCMWHAISGQFIPFGGTEITYPHSTYKIKELNSHQFACSKENIIDVTAIDGMFMATCYDYPWNTKTLKDWDFYDSFHSITFLEHGLRIVIPHDCIPWIIHDDGRMLSLEKYNYYRHIFMNKYKSYLGLTADEIRIANGFEYNY